MAPPIKRHIDDAAHVGINLTPALDIDAAEAVTWAYRLMLGREPESRDVVEQHVRTLTPFSVGALRQRFACSEEFIALQRRVIGSAPEWPTHPGKGIFEAFRDQNTYQREAGFFRDILGIKTRVSYLPAIYAKWSGGLAGDEGIEILPMHDEIELKAMRDAGGEAVANLTVMELGAGWGPWISIGARMARARGLTYRLIAVEGSKDHFDYLQTHAADNALDLERCSLVHGIVSATSGIARFPKMSDPSSDYGASISSAATGTGEFEEVRAYTIADLLKGENVVDILHCDIQGYEVEAIAASLPAVCKKVRRIVAGTHGRQIEKELKGLFSEAGWIIIDDASCKIQRVGERDELIEDGAQYWLNPEVR